MTIRQVIQNELKRRSWSRYRLIKELKGAIPDSTVYDYLRGEFDLSSDRVSIILQALGLQITPIKKRGRRLRKEKKK